MACTNYIPNFDRMLADCIQSHGQMAIFAFPGENIRHVVMPGRSECRFSIYPFGNAIGKKPADFNSCLNGNQLIEPTPCSHDEYVTSLTQLIDELKADGGKAVFSRVRQIKSHISPAVVSKVYWDKHPDTFRYICVSPETGVWFGATPELILRRRDDGLYETMALAGTRRVTSAPWDVKNTDEHEFVIQHIADVLNNCGLDYRIGDSHAIAFGDIEHLTHLIAFTPGNFGLSELALKLSPTPAICGYPVNLALDRITYYEKSPRYYYGGEIMACVDRREECYLNLRCAHASLNDDGAWTYSIYCGGGITAMSEVENEWTETALKSASLAEAISQSEMM